ncbi:ImmA/IrrE family metallo-endopeptidase [Patescibacteria group bacterium]|nr:ImmA/IrrE family metallo-endopeptidase [Patescibacteria group bacterium]
MNYQKIIVPYLGNTKIEKETGRFREKFWDDNVPVDIEFIIDVKLRVNVIPIPSFLKLANIDALITSDWKSIYVDRDEYLDERRHNRLRFSLAHEIGHFVLHKKIYSNFNIKNLEDYYKFNKDIPQKQYSYLETQANKFANYLLVPRRALMIEREKELKKKGSPAWFDKVDTKTFEVVTIALNDLNNKI